MLTAFAQMIALDAKTGQPVKSFGTDGRVDLAQGLRRPVDREYYTMSSPAVIVRNVIVVGSSVMVFTHIPSSIFLIVAAFSPNLILALALLLLRAALSQMDVPTRTSYVMGTAMYDRAPPSLTTGFDGCSDM